MSSTNKTANYQLSQFVGTDIPSILNDYNGDMRKIDTAIKEVANAEGSSAADIAGLQATVGQHTTEIGGLSSTVNSLSGRVIGIESKIPANASEQNKLITAEDIPEIPSIEGLENSVTELQEEVSDMGGDVKAIQLCVPADASSDNQFATKADIVSGGSGINMIYDSANDNATNLSDRLFNALNAINQFASQNHYDTSAVLAKCVFNVGGSVFRQIQYAPMIAISRNFMRITDNTDIDNHCPTFEYIEQIDPDTGIHGFGYTTSYARRKNYDSGYDAVVITEDEFTSESPATGMNSKSLTVIL